MFGEVDFGEVVTSEKVFGEVVFGEVVTREVVFGEMLAGEIVFGEVEVTGEVILIHPSDMKESSGCAGSEGL